PWPAEWPSSTSTTTAISIFSSPTEPTSRLSKNLRQNIPTGFSRTTAKVISPTSPPKQDWQAKASTTASPSETTTMTDSKTSSSAACTPTTSIATTATGRSPT